MASSCSSSSGVGIGGIEEVVNASAKELLIIREEFNKMHEEFILLKQFMDSDSCQLASNDPQRQKDIEDAIQYWFQCLQRRLDEIMKIADAIRNTMVELQKELMHGDKVEELELNKGIEEILEGLQGMKVID